MKPQRSEAGYSEPLCGALSLFFLFLLTTADQYTKYLAGASLRGQGAYVLINRVLELRYLENRGIAWGLFQGKIPVFLFFSIFFFLIVIFVYIRLPKTTYYLPLLAVLNLLTAGALGNFLDRAFRGYVIDFIYVSLIHFPVFNLADVYVVSSGIVLMLLVLFQYQDDDFYFLHFQKRRGSDQ